MTALLFITEVRVFGLLLLLSVFPAAACVSLVTVCVINSLLIINLIGFGFVSTYFYESVMDFKDEPTDC